MRKVILFACLLVTAVLAITVNAGLVHIPSSGMTRYMAGVPTPVSLWGRTAKGDVYPTTRPIVFQESTRHLITTANNPTNTMLSTGLWLWDGNGDVYVNSSAIQPARQRATDHVNGWLDVEWGVNTNGDVYPKK